MIKSKIKKIISLVLVFTIIFSMPVNVFANGLEDKDNSNIANMENDVKEEIGEYEEDIIKGTDETVGEPKVIDKVIENNTFSSVLRDGENKDDITFDTYIGIKGPNDEDYYNTSYYSLKVDPEDTISMQTTVYLKDYVDKISEINDEGNNGNGLIEKNDFNLKISIKFPEEIVLPDNLNDMKKLISFKISTDEEYKDIFIIDEKSMEFNDAERTLKFNIVNKDSYKDMILSDFLSNKLIGLENNWGESKLEISDLKIAKEADGYFPIIVTVDGEYNLEISEPDVKINGKLSGYISDYEKDYLYINREELLENPDEIFPEYFTASVSAYVERHKLEGDLLVKNKEKEDYDSENTKLFEVKNGDKIDLRYKMDLYDIYNELEGFLWFAETLPVKNYTSSFVGKIIFPEGVRFEKGVKIKDSIEFKMPGDSDFYILDDSKEPIYNESTGELLIYFKSGMEDFTGMTVQGMYDILGAMVDDTDGENPTIDAIFDIKNLIIDSKVGEKLTVKSKVTGDAYVTVGLGFFNRKYKKDFKILQKPGGEDFNFPDEKEKVTLTMKVTGDSPTEPEKPVGTIKNITLIGGKATLTEKIEEQLKEFTINRISGKDRYATSVEVSKEYGKRDTVVLASGEKYTDELTATVLASKMDVPILLSLKDEVPAVVMKEIERLGAKKVIIVGETGTISKKVEKQLSSYTLERIGGKTRYETAILLGDQIRKITGKTEEVILVDGTNFPDAIAMTSMGVEQEIPILLTEPSNLRDSTAKTIKDWKISKVTIGGGTVSVGSSIENKLKETIKVDRIKGADRYETSVLVAKQVYKNPVHAVVASGEVFPDAIVGAPYAAKNKYPIVLSRGNSVPQVVLNYVNGK